MKMRDEVKEWKMFIVSLIPHKIKVPIFSYKPLLIYTLKKYNPKRIIEWGTGKSTFIIAETYPEAEVVTIEHQRKWFYRWRPCLPKNVKMFLLKSRNNYSTPSFPKGYFDFAFIDGAERDKCLESCLSLLKPNSPVMIHDFQDYKDLKILSKFKLVDVKTVEKTQTALLTIK